MAESDREAKIARGCWNTFLMVAIIGSFLVTRIFPDGFGSSTESSDSLRWERYDVTITIREDGSAHVTESQDVRFDGIYRQGYAEIPIERIERISNVQVTLEGAPEDTNDDGILTRAEAQNAGEMRRAVKVDKLAFGLEPYEFRTEQTDSEFLIDYAFEPTGAGSSYYYAPSPQVRTIVLEYDVDGVIRDYPEAEEPWQQIHWMAISSEVMEIAPVQASTVTIILPEAVPVETLAYAPDPDTIEADRLVWTRTNLDEGDELDVQVAFPSITSATAPLWQPAADARDAAAEEAENRRSLASVMLIGAGILTGVAGGLGVLYAWYTRIREAVPGLVPDRLTEPPDDLPAALVGTLVDEEVHPRDVAAAIMDLDRRGIIRVRERQLEGTPTFRQRSGHEIELLQPDADVPEYERLILKGIYGRETIAGAVRDFHALRALFGGLRADIQRAMEQELVDRGYLTELPAESQTRWIKILRGGVVLSVVVALGFLVWTRTWTWWALVPPAVGILIYILGKRLTPQIARKTMLGAETSARWLAFQRHLVSVGADYFTKEAQLLKETYLPWAIAFGLDHQWLSRMNAPAPSLQPPAPSTSMSRGWPRIEEIERRSTQAGGSRRSTWTPSTPSWGWDAGSWGDMQGASDSIFSKLGSGSESMFRMLGDAMEIIGESGGGSGGGGGSRGSRGSSRSGGGRSRSSSGGGGRGFR